MPLPDAPAHIGVFDLFRVGIGPSSSHTVGPMRAAAAFAEELAAAPDGATAERIDVELFGSLAATGRGHGTFGAVLLGLEGERPDEVDPVGLEARLDAIGSAGAVVVPGIGPVACRADAFVLRPLTVHDRHPNALTFSALGAAGEVLLRGTWFSIGGGFIEREGETAVTADDRPAAIPFASAAELLEHCAATGSSIADVARANEPVQGDALREGVLRIARVMEDCWLAALVRTGPLPGGLGVRRRAPGLHEHLTAVDPERRPEYWQEWTNLVALAVNEENASGGRVVTAPTNGAAGIVPAVLHYALHYTEAAAVDAPAREAVIEEFFLTAAAIGALYKRNASISGAEVGCQGEVGSASSMAAAGLAAVLGGTPAQVENAAEIAMEHNLGLTCDPIGGLVQVPCIERNAIGAAKAVNAAKMALWGDGTHLVSLDQVIATMRATGLDMHSKYKETSLGGLAVNVVDC